jgi:protein-tyrosine-phosphatase/predicted ATP-grasp superfamily ATP-dependent carboligase
MAKILVVGGNCSAALAIVQSLGRAGHQQVLAGASKDHQAFASRYPSAKLVHPNPMNDCEGYLRWVMQLTAERGFDLIIPPTEETLLPLHEHRDEPILAGKLAIPPKDAVDLAFDKERLRLLAIELGVPTPSNVLAEDASALESEQIDQWLAEGAVVVKTTMSKIFKDGRAREYTAAMFDDRQTLEQEVRELLTMTPVQLQQWVPGRGLGIEVLANHGEIVLTFAHQRINEVPLTGGASSYRKSVVPPAKLVEDSAKLMRALDWHGVAMVEFRYDAESGKHWLMEINGRFWGSLPLCTFAGADFPAALVDMLLEGKLPSGPPPRTDVYARRFSREISWIKHSIKHRNDDNPMLLKRPLGEALLEWTRPLYGRETWDGASLSDPGPLAYEVATAIGEEFTTLGRKLRRQVILRRAKKQSQAVLSKVGRAQRILVLCYGNICRSPYAERRLAELLSDREVSSSGFHQRDNRPSPDFVQEISRKRGIELVDHRSSRVTVAELDAADLLLIMDLRNRDLLHQLHAPALKKTVWLGVLDPEGPVEIEDPYDLETDEAEEVYARLDRALQALAARLAD